LESLNPEQQAYVADLLTVVAPDKKDQLLQKITAGLAAAQEGPKVQSAKADLGNVHFEFNCDYSKPGKGYYDVLLRKNAAAPSEK
jgi:hypothetical protein